MTKPLLQFTFSWRINRPFLYFFTLGPWFGFSLVMLPYMEGLVSARRPLSRRT
jgi:hypothetical protein